MSCRQTAECSYNLISWREYLHICQRSPGSAFLSVPGRWHLPIQAPRRAHHDRSRPRPMLIACRVESMRTSAHQAFLWGESCLRRRNCSHPDPVLRQKNCRIADVRQIVSNNRVETARYSDRAPSDGRYELSDVRTIRSRVAGGISVTDSPTRACKASAASAIFSSAVNATNGRTAVTRDSREGCT